MEAHQEGGDHMMIIENMQSHIKRKRTKRPRPSSILTLSLASTSSSSTTTDEPRAPTNYHSIEFTNIFQENNANDDQNIADCLMLLAHGNHYLPAPEPLNMVFPPPSYVYECNICDRGFPSFQALGGHKASHNKPHREVHEVSKSRSTSLFIRPNKRLTTYNNPSGSTKGPRVHECVICGSDFTSGQALGGHMRRHRPIIMKATTITSNTNTSANHTSSYRCHESKAQKTILMLDLNLPAAAPIEDDHSETKIPFGSNNQQISIFPSLSLVDCQL